MKCIRIMLFGLAFLCASASAALLSPEEETTLESLTEQYCGSGRAYCDCLLGEFKKTFGSSQLKVFQLMVDQEPSSGMRIGDASMTYAQIDKAEQGCAALRED